MSVFRQITADDIIAAGRQLPDKQCLLDPMPMRVLKDNVDVLAPFLATLFNRPLMLGIFLSQFKVAHITPLLKKSTSIRLMSSHIDRSRTCRSYQSWLSSWLLASFSTTSQRKTYCQSCSPSTGRTTRLKRLYLKILTGILRC